MTSFVMSEKNQLMFLLSSSRSALKRATNVTLAENLLSEAKALHINISQAAELWSRIPGKLLSAWGMSFERGEVMINPSPMACVDASYLLAGKHRRLQANEPLAKPRQ